MRVAQGWMDPRARRRNSRHTGTATLEAALTLPVIAVVLVLLFETTRGWGIRMKAQSAARLAATQEIHRLQRDSGMGSPPTGEQMAREYYSGPLTEYRLRWPNSSPVPSAGGGTEIWTARAARLGPAARAEVELAYKVPAGTLLPTTRARAGLVVSGHTWNYDLCPVALGETGGLDDELETVARQGDGIRHLLGPFGWVSGSIFQGFYWLLGMEA